MSSYFYMMIIGCKWSPTMVVSHFIGHKTPIARDITTLDSIVHDYKIANPAVGAWCSMTQQSLEPSRYQEISSERGSMSLPL